MTVKPLLAISLAVVFSVPFQAHAQGASAPACLYASRAYSEGAHLCAEKGLMMTCTAGSTGLAWKLAEELGSHCGGPLRIRPARAGKPAHAPVRVSAPPPAGGEKCFNFNGKRYCE